MVRLQKITDNIQIIWDDTKICQVVKTALIE